VIAATNRDLLARVASGAFREDLYYRLNVIRIYIPPLRERRQDIPELFEHFLDASSQTHRTARPVLTDGAIELLTAYRWPGNIRELKNCAERLALRFPGAPVTPRDLPAEVRASVATPVREAAPQIDRANELLIRITKGESFWSAVYPEFIRRDITRETVRQVVSHGLRQTAGNYRLVIGLFNMPATDYKRFLSFLRKYDCHVPFRMFRTAPQTCAGRTLDERSEAAELP
jgi:DNA-binding NtrC family response regulator